MTPRLPRAAGIPFRAVLLRIEDWLIPPACIHCGARRLGSLPLCRPCLRILRRGATEEDEAVSGMPWIRALFRLSPPLHDLAHGFKYRGERRHIRFLCAWLRRRRAWLLDLGVTYDALVPVPLHPARRRERGYNQAREIAEEIRRLGGVPVLESVLRRVRHTGTQTRLGGGARHGNLAGAFRAGSGAAGKRLLLVDDVCTTGSTLAHCRDALLDAGAARVDALTLAWVEKDRPAPGIRLESAAGFFA